MQIVHVLWALPDASGVSVFCAELAKAQMLAGHDVTIVYHHDLRYAVDGRIRLLQVSGLEQLPFRPDVVHHHAIWSRFSADAIRFCHERKIPYVVSPHGGLMPRVLAKGWLKKFVVWHFLLKPLVNRAAAIHCTAESEHRACVKLGLRGPFVVAPLGVYLPEVTVKGRGEGEEEGRTVLFLGRISEEKGLMNLLEAWRQLEKSAFSRLVIAGPDWLGYKTVLDRKIAEDGVGGVVFTGNADAEMKDRLYRQADVFVLPSPMENFSMVVLEALAYGVPVIATKGTPWGELETEHCGLWIDQGVAPLKDALSKLLLLPASKLQALGANGRALAERKYQWSVIAQTLLTCYKNVVLL